jgi:adenylate cyclase
VGSAEIDSAGSFKLLDEAINSNEKPGWIMKECLVIIVNALKCEKAFIMLYDSNLSALNVVAGHNINPRQFDDAEVSQTIIDKVFSEGKPVIAYNALTDERFSTKLSVVLSGLRSILCVPLKAEDSLKGLIYADNSKKSNAFKKVHLLFLEECANRLAPAVARLFPESRTGDED